MNHPGIPFSVLPAPGAQSSAASQRKFLRRTSHLLSLEQRFMFDAAAVATAADAAHSGDPHDASHVADAAAAAHLVRPADPGANDGKKEVVFVNTSLVNYQVLEAGVRAGVAVVEFNGQADGLAQIAQWAQSNTGYDAIHIFSHGAAGVLNLGSTVLDAQALASDAIKAALADIGHALNAGGDLLLYGCDIAAGPDGQLFINDVARLTGADVAASTDATGAASLGGNWTLESHVGSIDARALSVDAYEGVMQVFAFSAANVPGNTQTFTANIEGQNFLFSAIGSASSRLGYRSDSGGPGMYSMDVRGVADGGGFTISAPSGYTFDLNAVVLGWFGDIPMNFVTARYADGSTRTTQFSASSTNLPDGFANDVVSIQIYSIQNSSQTNLSYRSVEIVDVKQIPVVTDNNISITSTGTGIGGAYKIGDTVSARWNNTSSGDNSRGIVAATFDFSQFGGSATAAGTNTNGIWTASYTVVAGNIDTVNRNVSVRASNGSMVRTGVDSTNLTVDNIAPTITPARISISGATGAGGAYKVGDVVTVRWNNTAAGDNNSDVIAGATVNFSEFGGSVVAASNAGGLWSASYTITAGSIDSLNRTALVTVMDNAGNTTARSSGGVRVDNILPTVVITTNISRLASGETATITFNFSEDPAATFTWNGTSGDLVIAGGLLSAISGSGLTRTAVFTPTANVNSGTASITVTAGSYADMVGNSAVSGATLALTYDTLAPNAPSVPVMAATSDTGFANNDAVTRNTTPTFVGTAEAGSTVILYDSNGITVLGSGVADGSGNWSITTSVLSEGTHFIQAMAVDAAANASPRSAPLTVTIDTTPPGVTITSNVSSLRSGETATITFAFTEDPGSTFTQGDITVSGGTLSAITGSGLTRTATFTPTASTNGGTASITVTADSYTDVAGNSGAAGASPALSFDTLVPNAPSAPLMTSASDTGVSNSDGITRNTTPTFTGTAEAGSTVRIYDTDRTTVLGTGLADGSGNWSITTSLLSQGAHTITARATDSAGNLSARSAGQVVSIDTTPPTVIITSNVSTLKSGETATITFTFTEDPGSTFVQGDIVVSGGTLSAFTGTGSIRTATFTPTDNVNNGTASITVTAGSYTDVAGNNGGAGAAPALSYDTLAPNAPSTPVMTSASDTGVSNSDGITRNTTPTFTGTAEAGTTVTLLDSDGITVLGTAVATGGNWSITTVLSQGLHSLTARTTDSVGNVSGLSAVAAITIDTTPPGITVTSNVSSLRSGETATITFAFTEDPGSTFTQGDITVSGGTLSAITGSGLTRTAIFTPTASTNGGTASITVAAGSYTDVAGNSGTAGTSPVLNFDTLAPGAPSAPVMTSASDTGVSNSDGITRNTTPTFTGTAEAGSTVRIYDTDRTTVLGTGLADGSGNWSITSSTLSEGAHTITARATDSAGNLGTRSAGQVASIDTTPPTVTITSNVSNLKSGETATITFTFTEDPGSTFVQGDIVVSGGTLSAITGSGLIRTATFTPTDNVNNGAASITVTAGSYTDVAGNNGDAGAAPALSFDTLAPNAPSAPVMTSASDTGVSNNDGITRNTTPTFVGTAEAGVTVILYDTNGTTVLGTAVVDGSGNWSITTSVLGEGSHVVQAMAVDASGNVGPHSAALVVVIDTTPPGITITSNVGSLRIGETATITFAFTEDPGSTFTQGDITVSGGTLSAITGSGLTRTATFTPTVSTNGGTASITVAAGSYTDRAGNIGGAGASPALSFDTLAPNAPSAPVMTSASDTGVSNSDGITRNTTPTFTGTAEAGTTVALLDSDGVTVLGSAVATGGNWSITTSVLSQGAHTITARATDSAGNLGARSAGQVVSIDTTPPTVSITSNVGALKSGETATITFTFTEDPGSTFTQGDIAVSGGTLSAMTGSGLTRTAIFTPTDHISSGAGNITVAAGSYTDVAGNNGGAGAVSTISFNTLVPVPPSAPLMTSASDTGVSNSDGITNTTTPTFVGTAEAGATVTLYDTDGTTVLGSAVATGGNWSITVSALAQGGHTLHATASDGAGNVSGLSGAAVIVIDTTPPGVTITSNVGSLKSGETATITFTFTEDPGSTFVQGDIAVSGGTLSAMTGSGLTRTAIFTPTDHISSGAANITVAAGSYTDVAGNNGGAGAVTTISFNTLVPVPPSAPLMTSASDTGVSNSDGITNTTTPTFVGTAEAGATVTLYDTDGTTVLGTAVATGGNWSITVSTLTQGSHTLHATASDGAGNVSGLSAAAVIVIDTTPPGVTITSNVGSLRIGETATITFTFTEDPGSTFTQGDIVVSGGTLSAIAGSGLTRTASFTPTAGTNGGTASITIVAGSYTDVAGNNGAAGVTPALSFDTLAPTAPAAPVMSGASDTGVSNSDGITRNTTPTFTGTAEAGSTVRLYDTDGVTLLGTAVATGGNWSITTSTLTEGNHVLRVSATDGSGNVSALSSAAAVTIDTTAPGVNITSNVGSLKSGETAAITFTFSEDPGSTFTLASVVVSGGTLSAISGSGLTRTAVFTPTDNVNSGAASITVAAGSYTDAAGNSGTAGATPTLPYDTLAPNAPSAPVMTSASDTGVSNSDGITNNTTPTFIGTAEAGARVILYDTNGITVLGSTVANGSGNWSITTSVLSEGTHVVQAAAIDASGNVSPRSEVVAVILNTITPTLVITSNVASLRSGETATITFAFTEDPGSTFTQGDIAVSGGTLSAITGSGLTRTAIFTPTASTNGGTASITVAAGSYTDVAGNGGTAGASPVLSFDTLAPGAPSAPVMTSASDTGVSSSDGITRNTTPTFTGTAEAGSTVRIYDTDRTTVLGTGVADGSGNWSITTSVLSEGAHTITARATDSAGNPGTRSAGQVVSIDTTPPTVTITSNIGDFKIGETATITFTFTEDPGNTFTQGSVVVSGGTLSAISGSGTIRTAIFTPTANTNGGTANITVTAGSYADVAGNSGVAGVTPALTFDTLAPNAPSAPVMTSASDTGVSSSDGITNNTTPTFTGTAEAGARVILYDTNGITVLGTTVADGSGNWSITASVLSEGTHVLQAAAIDAAGNVSPRSEVLVVILDTITPTLVITSNVASLRSGETATITFAFTEDPGSTFTQGDITVSGGTLSAITGSGLTRTATFTPTASTNGGTASITVVAGSYTDVAGNIGAAGVTPALSFDTLAPGAPSAPVMTSASDTGVSNSDGITRNTTPTFTGTAEAGSTVRIYDTDRTTVLGTGLADGSGNWSITTSVLSEGAHTITARATDSAGNLGTRSAGQVASIDTTPPTVTITTNVSTLKIGETATITFTFTEDPGSTFTQGDIVVSGGTLSAITGTGPIRTAIFTPTASTNGGTANITVTAGSYTDVAGNNGGAGAAPALSFDTLAPNTPSLPVMNSGSDSGVSNSDAITNNATPTFTGTAEAGSTVTLYGSNGIVVLGSGVADGSGNWSITVSAMAEGEYEVNAAATDGAGNVSSRSSSLSVAIITTPPPQTVTDVGFSGANGLLAGNLLTSTTAHTISGTLSAPLGVRQSVQVSLDNGATWSNADATIGSATWSINGTLNVAGSTIRIRVSDLAGNTGATWSQAYLVDTTPPTVVSVTAPADRTYSFGENLDFVVRFSEVVVVNTSTGMPGIALTLDTGGTVQATYVSGAGTDSLVFRYAIPNNVRDLTGVSVGALTASGGLITDSAGNNATLALNGLGSTAGVIVDGVDPNAVSVNIINGSGSYGAGSIITIAVTYDRLMEVNAAGGAPSFTLNSGGTATYTSGAGTSVLLFTYEVKPGENAAGLDLGGALLLNGGTVVDAATLQVNAQLPLGPGLSSHLNIVIDTIAPATPVIDSVNTGGLQPVFAGSAIVGPGESLTVTVGGATYSVVTTAGGAWSLNLASATPISGSLSLVPGSIYPVTAIVTDLAGNRSTASTTMQVSAAPPSVLRPPVNRPFTFLSTPLFASRSDVDSFGTGVAVRVSAFALPEWSRDLSRSSLVDDNETALAAEARLNDPASESKLTLGGGFAVSVLAQGRAGDGIVVNKGLRDQLLPATSYTEFFVPPDAFSHDDAYAAIYLSATQSDGKPLPKWLSFNPATGKFIVDAKACLSGEVSVTVVAHDGQGKAVSTQFNVRIGEQGGGAGASSEHAGCVALSEQIRMAAQPPRDIVADHLARLMATLPLQEA